MAHRLQIPAHEEGPAVSILLFINLKGGVAKTTNAVATAECLAEAGHRVLL